MIFITDKSIIFLKAENIFISNSLHLFIFFIPLMSFENGKIQLVSQREKLIINNFYSRRLQNASKISRRNSKSETPSKIY